MVKPNELKMFDLHVSTTRGLWGLNPQNLSLRP